MFDLLNNVLNTTEFVALIDKLVSKYRIAHNKERNGRDLF
jgi:hypothetical protein